MGEQTTFSDRATQMVCEFVLKDMDEDFKMSINVPVQTNKCTTALYHVNETNLQINTHPFLAKTFDGALSISHLCFIKSHASNEEHKLDHSCY